MPNLYFPIVIQQGYRFVGVQIEGNIADRSVYLKPNTHAQVGIRWDEPNWERLDNGIPAIKNKGCTVGIGTRACPQEHRLYPEWKSSQPKPDSYQAYVDFILTLCQRYNPNYIEIWNEPDIDKDYLDCDNWWMGAWGDEDDDLYGGRAYGDLLKLLYPQVKANYPNILIVAGALLLPMDGTMSGDEQGKFIQGVVESGGLFDLVSCHNYVHYPDTRWDRHIEKADYLSQITQKQVIITETSLLSNDGGEAFEQKQAEYYKHVYDSMVEGFDMKFHGFLWYSLANNNWLHSDLVENDTKKPAWYKYEELA